MRPKLVMPTPHPPHTNVPSREDHFAVVYTSLYHQLVRLAYTTTGSLAVAEDVVQDSFVQLYGRWDTVTMPDPWLRRAVISNSASWARRWKRERHGPLFSEPHVDRSAREFLSILSPLTPRQRCAVFLKYHEGFSEQQIAVTIGCRPGTVKSLLSRALDILRKEIGTND